MNKELLLQQHAGSYLDALVVLGKNIGIDSTRENITNDNFHLSQDSRMNALAGGLIFKAEQARGNTVDIIFSTGKTAGEEIRSEAKAMSDFVQRKFPDIPREHIILEETSIDTAGNALEVSKIVKEKGYKNIGLVTVGYHLENAVTLFERYGTPVQQTFAAEAIVRDRSSRHEQFINEWEASPRVRKEKMKEQIRKVLLHTIDPKGKLIGLLTKKRKE